MLAPTSTDLISNELLRQLDRHSTLDDGLTINATPIASLLHCEACIFINSGFCTYISEATHAISS